MTPERHETFRRTGPRKVESEHGWVHVPGRTGIRMSYGRHRLLRRSFFVDSEMLATPSTIGVYFDGSKAAAGKNADAHLAFLLAALDALGLTVELF